jgi:uncharacterized coiled-coil protein SlyX
MKKKTPINDLTPEERGNYNSAILEDLRSNFKVFGEALTSFGKKLEQVAARGEATFEEVGRMSVRLTAVENRLTSIESRLDVLECDVKLIKDDVAEIKKILTTKADIKHIMLFESRIARLEHRVAQK